MFRYLSKLSWENCFSMFFLVLYSARSGLCYVWHQAWDDFATMSSFLFFVCVHHGLRGFITPSFLVVGLICFEEGVLCQKEKASSIFYPMFSCRRFVL